MKDNNRREEGGREGERCLNVRSLKRYDKYVQGETSLENTNKSFFSLFSCFIFTCGFGFWKVN